MPWEHSICDIRRRADGLFIQEGFVFTLNLQKSGFRWRGNVASMMLGAWIVI